MGSEVSLIFRLLSKFYGKKSVHANRARHTFIKMESLFCLGLIIVRIRSVLTLLAGYYINKDGNSPWILHLLEWKLSLLIGLYTTLIRLGSFLASRARYYIY